MPTIRSRLEDNTFKPIDSGSGREGLCVYQLPGLEKVALALANAEATAKVLGVIIADRNTTVELARWGDTDILPETSHPTPSPGDTIYLSTTQVGRVTTTPPISGVLVTIGEVAWFDSPLIHANLSIAQPIVLY